MNHSWSSLASQLNQTSMLRAQRETAGKNKVESDRGRQPTPTPLASPFTPTDVHMHLDIHSIHTHACSTHINNNKQCGEIQSVEALFNVNSIP